MHMYISIYNHIYNINETFPTISWTPGGHSRSTYAKLQREEYYTTSIHKLSQGTQKIQKLVAQHVRFFLLFVFVLDWCLSACEFAVILV